MRKNRYRNTHLQRRQNQQLRAPRPTCLWMTDLRRLSCYKQPIYLCLHKFLYICLFNYTEWFTKKSVLMLAE
jgi:hypothetical protein